MLVHRGDGRVPLTACDAALVKSGTGTLEAMLLRRPMVVSYRLGPLAARLARRLLHTDFVALPNILAGRALVPELLQERATPQALADQLLNELDKSFVSQNICRHFRPCTSACAEVPTNVPRMRWPH